MQPSPSADTSRSPSLRCCMRLPRCLVNGRCRCYGFASLPAVKNATANRNRNTGTLRSLTSRRAKRPSCPNWHANCLHHANNLRQRAVKRGERMRFDLGQQRERMVERQLARRGIRDPAVMRAMRNVPRDKFVPDHLREFAYDDTPLPIDAEQTISQPYIVALMTDALELEPDDKVLEIGTGSGYAAAILAEIAAEIFTIERHETVCTSASARREKLGLRNVHVRG